MRTSLEKFKQFWNGPTLPTLFTNVDECKTIEFTRSGTSRYTSTILGKSTDRNSLRFVVEEKDLGITRKNLFLTSKAAATIETIETFIWTIETFKTLYWKYVRQHIKQAAV
ncbi:hypothetical protein BpHYR1_019718 [Brachionus plicatilis]|uniref:Uncharacterized protein n=1 Tax=Brachionus plicatilis TaxID=10195 RepID=A0A3M7PY50_BRAPC|nr:hypothetical protein BpHYR1_019718 [Brachionus plicatilis]